MAGHTFIHISRCCLSVCVSHHHPPPKLQTPIYMSTLFLRAPTNYIRLLGLQFLRTGYFNICGADCFWSCHHFNKCLLIYIHPYLHVILHYNNVTQNQKPPSYRRHLTISPVPTATGISNELLQTTKSHKVTTNYQQEDIVFQQIYISTHTCIYTKSRKGNMWHM